MITPTAANDIAANQPAIGVSLGRFEDPALLTGNGCFMDDLNRPEQLYAWVLRSPHAHARILSIDYDEALAMDGVLGVFTAADMLDLNPLDESPQISQGRTVRGVFNIPRPVSARDRVAHVGDTVAVVVATAREQAADAVEQIAIEYQELPPVVDAEIALTTDAPPIWNDAPGNLALEWEAGDRAATSAAFAGAAHVTRLRLHNNRVVIAPMETRGVIAEYDSTRDHFTLYVPSQGVNKMRDDVAAALGRSAAQIRVITPDVGGSFGMKIPLYPEYILCAWLAQRFNRPVKWIAEREDAFITDGQGRDHTTVAQIALDKEHRILAIDLDTVSNMGAYASQSALSIPTTGGARCATGVYRIPTWHGRTRVAYTNTVPVVAYRGAGKPEYNYIIERLIDEAAATAGIDAAEIRRRNAVPVDAMPYATQTWLEFDCGDFVGNMDQALRLADRNGFADRRSASQAENKLRGFGFALFQEPDGFYDKRVTLALDADGALNLTMTGQSAGHGHATTFAQIAADQLGISPNAVRVIQGDSDIVGSGGGTAGSATTTVIGTAIVRTSNSIIDQGKTIAGQLLEVDPTVVEFANGRYAVAGSNFSVSIAEVAEAAAITAASDTDLTGQNPNTKLRATCHYVAERYNYPCGCHVCELEVDTETGAVTILRYLAVNDHGVVINPLLLAGQIHGGIAQGLGQALTEHVVFDTDSGQLLSGSFMDYCLPRARHLPDIELSYLNIPTATNPLGVKGVGESGCTAACPAIMNALADALRSYGAKPVDMPATSMVVWQELRKTDAEKRKKGSLT